MWGSRTCGAAPHPPHRSYATPKSGDPEIVLCLFKNPRIPDVGSRDSKLLRCPFKGLKMLHCAFKDPQIWGPHTCGAAPHPPHRSYATPNLGDPKIVLCLFKNPKFPGPESLRCPFKDLKMLHCAFKSLQIWGPHTCGAAPHPPHRSYATPKSGDPKIVLCLFKNPKFPGPKLQRCPFKDLKMLRCPFKDPHIWAPRLLGPPTFGTPHIWAPQLLGPPAFGPPIFGPPDF